MEIQIFSKDGSLKMTISCDSTCTHQTALQGDNMLSLSFTYFEFVEIDVNDYAEFEGERFRAAERYVPQQVSTIEWKYSIQLYAVQSLVKRFLVMMLTDGAYETEFSLTAPASEHLMMIVDCINAGMETSDWKTGECIQTENLTIDYSGTYCDTALATLAEKAGAEYWFDGETVNLVRCEHGNAISLAYGRELLSLERSSASNVKFFTRLFPIGSSRNIDPTAYGASRLMLPDGMKYIDDGTGQYGIIHHYEKEAFADIYPRRIGTVSSVRSSDAKSDDGKDFKIYWFKDESLDFDPADYEIAGLVKHVVFQSGELDGRDFEVNWHQDTGEFEIITQWPYDDDRQLPGETLVPAVGDKYILWNIKMPEEYYTAAEQELFEAAENFMEENRKDISVYKAHTNYLEIDRQKITLSLGQRIMLESPEYFPGSGYTVTRITRITRNLDCPSDMDIEMSAVVDKGALDAINDDIRETRSYVAQASSILPGIVKSWEETKLTDSNLMSSAKSVLEMARRSVSKLFDDVVSGVITFLKRPVASIGMEFGKFQSGQAGAGGAVLIDENGNSKAEVDYLNVRKVAQFNRLVIQDIKHAGGKLILSPASMVCSRVEETDDAYRCYFETEDSDGHSVYNQFSVGDQAIRQSFNMNESKYYWRLVTAVGDNWIDLSKTDCDAGSGIPEKGDEIVQLGNRTDTGRQSAHILSSYGDGAPSYEVFNGINSYSIAEKDIAGIVYNPYSKQPQVYCFGEMYVGDRNPDDEGATFMTFQRKEGETKPKAFFQGDVSIGTGSSGLTNLSEWAGKQDEINSAQQSANDAQSTAEQAMQKAQDAKDYIDNTLPGEISEINRKLDGVVENWYYSYTPTLSNEPAATWIKDGEQAKHIGDTFTNTQQYVDEKTTPDAGKSWRWVNENGTYAWTPIADSDSVKALQKAAAAQDTADQKRRVFVTTPYTPYDVGDMWMQGPEGEIMRCIKARQSGNYDKTDWDKASKYTDDTTVNNLVIGGRNYLPGTLKLENTLSITGDRIGNGYEEFTVLHYCNSKDTSADILQYEVTKFLKPDTDYVLSFYCKGTGYFYSYLYPLAVKEGISMDGTTTNSSDGYMPVQLTSEWRKIWIRWRTLSTLNGDKKILPIRLAPGAEIWSCGFKFEEGNKATAWSPAPEDTELESRKAKILSMSTMGNMLYADPEFSKDFNGIKLYTFHGTEGKATITRKKFDGVPNNSGYAIEIIDTHDAGGYRRVGWQFATVTSANKMLVCRFIARIPAGCIMEHSSNATGDNSTLMWLTDNVGTGEWEEYAYYVKAGASGAFSTTFYFYILSDYAPVTWQLAYATVYDLSSASHLISDVATAQETADAASARLDEWADDGKISPTEKPAIKDEITRIDSDKSEITDGYSKCGLGTPESYNSAYNTYRTQLVALSAETPENITIPTTFRTNQTNYYSKRTEALNAISSVLSQNRTETLIDASSLDDDKYYPVTVMLSTEGRTHIEVNTSLTDKFLPSWASHNQGFVCHARWSAYGNGYGYTAESRIIDLFQWSWCKDNVPPIGTVGQLTFSSFEYIYVRGGGKYHFITWGQPLKSNLILRTSDLSINGQTLTAPIDSVTVPKTTDDKINDAQSAADSAQATANTVKSTVTDMKNFTDTAFADGVISRAEATAIEKYKNSVNETLKSVTGTFQTLYSNTYLTGTAKSTLQSGYNDVSDYANQLLTKISDVIKDNVTTSSEKSSVDSLYNTFNNAIRAYNIAVELANKAIQDALKKYTDDRETALRNDYQYLKDTFGYVVDVNGVVLGKLVAVKDDNGEVQAMMNGSTLGQDNTHGKLLIAAGIDDIAHPENAKTRIYEKGLIDTDSLNARSGCTVGEFKIIVDDNNLTTLHHEDSSQNRKAYWNSNEFYMGKTNKFTTNGKFIIIGNDPSMGQPIINARSVMPGTGKNIAMMVSASGATTQINYRYSYGNYAISCDNGQFAGLRPMLRTISSNNYTLTNLDHTIIITSTAVTKINLPGYPENGQEFFIVNAKNSELQVYPLTVSKIFSMPAGADESVNNLAAYETAIYSFSSELNKWFLTVIKNKAVVPY